MEKLSASIDVKVRFSEVDSMNIVWHGNYAKYFEDAREAFGAKYKLGYLTIFSYGYYAPLVDLSFNYKRPLIYGDTAKVEITYRNCDAAKILFDYEIFSEKGELVATGKSVQVFLDKKYQLAWASPDFYIEWKQENGQI